jgi:Flp pilus assembly protein TadD
MAAIRAGIAFETGPAEAAAEWAHKAIEMSLSAKRTKYESVARAILGKALMSMGRRQEALTELQKAVKGADALGNPAARWRARADLAEALATTGDDDGHEIALREAAGIIREIEAGLAPERAKRFVTTPQVIRLLTAVR